MFKFSKNAINKMSDFFFDVAKFMLTGAVLLDWYQGIKSVSGNFMLIGSLSAVVFFVGGIIAANNSDENKLPKQLKKGGKK